MEEEEVKAERKRKTRRFAKRQYLSEEETRSIIDSKLRDAGWETDTQFF